MTNTRTQAPALHVVRGDVLVETDAAQMPERGGYELAVRITGLGRGTLRSMVSRGQIPHVRLSERIVRFDRATLENWFKSKAVAGR